MPQSNRGSRERHHGDQIFAGVWMLGFQGGGDLPSGLSFNTPAIQ